MAVPPFRLRVVLIEDSPRLRELIADMLGELDGIRVVGEASEEAAALRLLAEHSADLVIVDLELLAGSGFGVLRALACEPGRYGRPRAVVFSHHDHPQLRERCRQLGAERFFNKADQLDEMIDFLMACRRRAACGS